MDSIGVEVFDNERHRVFAVSGELDIATFDRTEERLLEAERDRPPVLLIDLRGLTFMDSQGVRLVLRAQQRASADGRRVVLVRGSHSVHRVFEVSGVAAVLEFVSDPSEVAAQPAPD